MSNSAEYDSYAYFGVTSELLLADINTYFGIPGEERSWSIGDIRKLGPGGKYELSSWKMKSGLKPGLPLEDHLTALWRRMERIREKVCEIPDEMHGVIQCVGYFKSHRDVCALSAGHYITAAYYQLNIDFDLYFDDDFGHENEGMPYWKW
ncbi:hypothetical protein ROA7450_00723 [Roseovarius albus]|uniref:DUF4279 domain-containing protein n=1 Tax=Roseovarius albus TaxID=1247867 RepID=A0A1X6YGX8_9RHOB|nr:DUF4279 domain-containing protein [Roseovarius albus]SLN20850.1 hypothetical protein ROA7450_00723 [Roseovarius albus]